MEERLERVVLLTWRRTTNKGKMMAVVTEDDN